MALYTCNILTSRALYSVQVRAGTSMSLKLGPVLVCVLSGGH